MEFKGFALEWSWFGDGLLGLKGVEVAVGIVDIVGIEGMEGIGGIGGIGGGGGESEGPRGRRVAVTRGIMIWKNVVWEQNRRGRGGTDGMTGWL